MVRKVTWTLLLMGCMLLPLQPARAATSADTPHKLDIETLKEQITARREVRAAKEALVARHARTGHAKMGPHIRALVEDRILRRAHPGAKGGPKADMPSVAKGPFLRVRQDDRVQVHLYTAHTDALLLSQLEATGFETEIANTTLNQVQGWIASGQLEVLAGIEGVERITAPRYGTSRRGSVTTQGDSILKANLLRAKGLTGEGIRVGIISDGANDWAAARARGDLPASGITRYGSCTKRAENQSQCLSRISCNEGTAMAEIIYDIAPGAKLAVAAASTKLDFIQRINQLSNDFGADIIVDDLGYYAEPYFEDGDIAKAVAALTKRVLFVSAAGNSADGHYERDYYPERRGTYHDFGLAQGQNPDIDQGVVIPGRKGLLMIMQWNDPFKASRNDYDMYLFDDYGIVGSSTEDQSSTAGSPPIEGFCYYNASSSDVIRWLLVDRFSGAGKRLEIFTLANVVQQYNHPQGSIFGHAGVPWALAVGTINASDPGHDKIAFYSSRGPARVDFPGLQNRRKPDLVGIDGVSVTGVGGFVSTFYGTSAAAPHVAGIAALLMSASPLVRPENVRDALIAGAVDLGSSGFDYTFGYGRANALTAYDLLKYGINIAPIIFLLLH